MEITINLLSPERKEKISSRKKERFIYRTGIIMLGMIAIFSIFLFFCIQAITIQTEAMDQQVKRLSLSENYTKLKKEEQKIKETEAKANQLEASFKNSKDFWKIFEELNGMMADDVYLQEFSISEGKLRFKGIAGSRQSVMDLKERLEKSDYFANIESPYTNFMESEHASFEFGAEIKALMPKKQ